MAITKTHPIKSTLKAAIDYICDPTKTDGKLLVSAYGCTAETADIEFGWTRRHAIDKGYNLGRHLIQAFSPGEVSPEEAHEIGMQLAKEILGGKYEFVLTTHVDKGHIHNHVIWNAVSFVDHKHYHSNKRSYHFTRLKTLGIDYTEEAISSRIAGGSRPSRKPKQRDDRIKLLMDIQSKQGAGLQHWAKLQNLKEAAKTVNFITEHGIDSYEELESKLAALTDARDRSLASIKETESRIADLALIDKYATTYRKYKPLYEKYKRSPDKEKFLRGHESKIILFEAAARELKRLGAVPLPSADRVSAELEELTTRKDALYAEYNTSKQQFREMETIKQNLDSLLPVQREQEPRRSHEIE